jgi:hypothetical protein
MEHLGPFAASFVAVFALAVGIWLIRPEPARLAGSAWLISAGWVFLTGALAGAVGVAAYFVLWPVAAALVLPAIVLFVRPGAIVYATSAALALVLLLMSGIAAATSSSEFGFLMGVAAGPFAAAALGSVFGLRTELRLNRALDASYGTVPDLDLPSRDEWDRDSHAGS